MSAETSSNRATLAVPTLEGVTDAVQAFQASMKAGKWILLAPDGRLWENANPMILFAVLAATMRGDPLEFEWPNQDKESRP